MTSFLLAATGLVVAFYGPQTIDPARIEPFEVVALIALVSGLFCAIVVLRPISDEEPPEIENLPVRHVGELHRKHVAWRGCVPVTQVLLLCETATDEGAARVALARELEARAKVDAGLLDARLKWVRICGYLLAIQVCAWTVALVG